MWLGSHDGEQAHRTRRTRRLSFAWERSGDVTIELETQGDEVLLTLVHRRIEDASENLGISAGWHAHLDVMAARLAGQAPPAFWDRFRELREMYAAE